MGGGAEGWAAWVERKRPRKARIFLTNIFDNMGGGNNNVDNLHSDFEVTWVPWMPYGLYWLNILPITLPVGKRAGKFLLH